MASSHSSFDPSAFSGNPAVFDLLIPPGTFQQDSAEFTELALDGEPLFPADWDQETPPYEGNLYSTPLSWDEPKIEPLNLPPTPYTTMNTLTPAQQEKLRNIAMPSHLQYRNQSSPNSTNSVKSRRSVSLPDAHEGNNEASARSRKRKSSASADEDEEEDEDSNPPAKKTAHNMIEKRYRVNLNEKIQGLADAVPSLRIMSKSQKGEDTADDRENLQGLQPAHKLNKATILAKATEYIQHLEKRNKKFESENREQKARLSAFETLFRSGSMGFNPQPMVYPQQSYSDYNTPGVSPCPEIQGMIQVPESMRRLHSQMAQQQQQQQFAARPEYGYPQQQVANNGWNGAGYAHKMMLGSLAGLMIFQGMSEHEQDADSPNARGLSAIPGLSSLARRFLSSKISSANINIGGQQISGTQMFRNLQIFLALLSLLMLALPYFTAMLPRRKGKEVQAGKMLSPAPSLASPIEARRQAWLNAVQTVWIPSQSFPAEVCALLIKIGRVSLRSILPLDWYHKAVIDAEEEQKRLNAWEIALDAQLAGGDVEINKQRLTLTLLASNTLPDTPARLMLRALHFRILFFAIGIERFKSSAVFREYAASWSQSQWNKARLLHRMAINQKDSEKEKLPEHLAVLLEFECDDVLVDEVAQRAYNLTWNKPTTQNSTENIDGMDKVVEDHYVRGPLDAVAAWFSSIILQRAMGQAFEAEEDAEQVKKAIGQDIALAIRTAPIGSIAHLRALVARAVLIKEKRGFSIAECLRTLGENKYNQQGPIPSLVNSKTPNISLHDIKTALNYAIAIAHLERFTAPHSPVTARQIITRVKPNLNSLVGLTAAYKLMEALDEHPVVSVACSDEFENLAGQIRIWTASKAGEKSGLSKVAKQVVVERCIGIKRRMVGVDDGYESMPGGDVEEGC